MFLVNSDLQGESCIYYVTLTKLTKKQKHTRCIEGQNLKNIVNFFIHLVYLTGGSNSNLLF